MSFFILHGNDLHKPTPAEIEAMFTLQNCPATYDTASNHVFDSWTDKDLYRAIDAPEHPEGPARDAEILEYVEELKKRKAEAERLAARSAELREKYQI